MNAKLIVDVLLEDDEDFDAKEFVHKTPDPDGWALKRLQKLGMEIVRFDGKVAVAKYVGKMPFPKLNPRQKWLTSYHKSQTGDPQHWNRWAKQMKHRISHVLQLGRGSNLVISPDTFAGEAPPQSPYEVTFYITLRGYEPPAFDEPFPGDV